MTIEFTQLSPTRLWVHNGNTSFMTIDNSTGVNFASALRVGGELISPSGAELSVLDGVTPGTVTASKAVVVNSASAVDTWKVTGQFTMGSLSSANDTSGIAISASKAFAHRVCADTGGAALTAGNYRAEVSRFLVGTTITSAADISTYGHEALCKMIVSANVGGNQGGVLGHLESQGTLTLTGTINTVKAGVASFLDLAANATVAANTVVSAFGVNSANFGSVMTGRSTIIHVTNPMAGTWGSFLDISSATGLTQDATAGAVNDKFLKVYVNTRLYTIPLYTSSD